VITGKPERRRPNRFLEAGLVLFVAGAGLAIRLSDLDAVPCWVDEAESSINALTILEKGYPSNSYLGQPIFENTLLWKWPESAEYEFRDVSYSERGFAVYHGWFPLYLIAGSFALYGIQPDEAGTSRKVKHDLADWKRRTRAARLPGAVFGMLFLLIVFAGAKIMYGRDAAWTALIVGCIHPWHLTLSRQARYYSPQIVLTTACCIMLWLLLKECRWRHVFLSALVFILLFHTHLLAFSAAAAVAVLIAPWIVRRHDFAIRKLAALAGLIALGTLPWVLVTGFYRQQGRIPGVWSMLHLPGDLLRYPPMRIPNIILGIVVVLLTICVVLGRPHLPDRYREPVLRLAPVLAFLGVWCVCAYALFLGLIPAVSFSASRLNLSYWGPKFLLGSIICAGLARIAVPRFSGVAAPVIMLVWFIGTGNRLELQPPDAGRAWEAITATFNALDAMHLDGTSRIYAAPNSHLILSFYSGLPIQSIAPVRKSFLDSYPGDIVYIDSPVFTDTGWLGAERIREEALRCGEDLSPEAAARWSVLLQTRDYREAMQETVAPGQAELVEAVPEFARELLIENRNRLWNEFLVSDMELFTRGFDIHSWLDWRTVVEYRYSDPLARWRPAANYAERLRGSRAILMSSGVAALYRSPWHPPGTREPVLFEFVP
jgi:hypothetical protein